VQKRYAPVPSLVNAGFADHVPACWRVPPSAPAWLTAPAPLPQDGGTELEDELVGGLAAYFDKALGQMLLYAAERGQYQDLMKQQVPRQRASLPCQARQRLMIAASLRAHSART